MLRVLGDINKIRDPSMHYEAFQTLLCVWKHLVEVRVRGDYREIGGEPFSCM